MPIITTLAADKFPSGGAKPVLPVDITILAQSSGGVEYGGTLGQYQAGTTVGANAGRTNSVLTASSLSLQGSGILSFTMPAGTFTWRAKSAGGSGTQNWSGFAATGTIAFAEATPVLLLIPVNGTDSYGGGGGLFFAKGTNFSGVVAADALIVLGGGGGGYSSTNSAGAPSPFYTTTADALSNRRSVGTEAYDAGGGFVASYTVFFYPGGGPAAQHFVQGGRGGQTSSCGAGRGGFGGGGGGCPGAGGGYAGGFAGSNSPAAYGGGGGTSYYNPSFVSGVSIETASSVRNTVFNSFNQADSGYFRIWSTLG